MGRIILALLALLVAAPASAQVLVDQQSPASTAAQQAAQTASAALQAAQAACLPDPAVPPMEMVGGAAGSGNSCRLANAVQPRITRAGTCTITTGGVCSGTWSTAFPSGQSINVIFTPINPSATLPVECNLTATPSVTSYSAKCWIIQTTTLSLAIVTTGLNLSPATVAPNGMMVQVTGLPVTQ